MIYRHLEQSGPEWLRWRNGGVGGSDAAVIMGVSPYSTEEKLFLLRTGQQDREESSYAMRRGQRLEAVGREEYCRRYGLEMEPVCGEHDTMDWMRASFDGVDLFGELLLEIKWIKWEYHQLALDGKIPEVYWPQVQHQLYVSGAERLHFWSCSENSRFAEEDRFALVEVRLDEKYCQELVRREALFWERVMEYRRQATDEAA